MADVAGENEADSGSGGPSTVADGNGTPEEDLERNDTERVTGKQILKHLHTFKAQNRVKWEWKKKFKFKFYSEKILILNIYSCFEKNRQNLRSWELNTYHKHKIKGNILFFN